MTGRQPVEETTMSDTITENQGAASTLGRTFTGAKPPLKPKQIWSIRTRLNLAKRVRDAALFDLAIDSKLRGCDLVRLRIGDVALHGSVRTRATVVQRKTGRPVTFEITEQARASVQGWLKVVGTRPEAHLFPSRVDRNGHLSTRQYGRLVDEWVALIGLDPCGLRNALAT
jgi:integrase